MSEKNENLHEETPVVETTEETVDTVDEVDTSEVTAAEEGNKELATLQEEKAALEDQVLRLQAEIANMQRVNTRERQEAARYRSQSLAVLLLEGLDNLERALGSEVTSEDAQSLKTGVQMVYDQFLNAFDKEKITVIDPMGEEFDPNYHHAVSLLPAQEGQAPNTVVQVLQKGYQLDDRVIRPAMVIVADEA